MAARSSTTASSTYHRPSSTALIDGRRESIPESWIKYEIAIRDLPLPQPQYWVVVEGVRKYRLDYAYPHARVAIEHGGEEFHTSPEDREADRTHRQWLREHGWTVIVLTKCDVTVEAVEEWIQELRTSLGLV